MDSEIYPKVTFDIDDYEFDVQERMKFWNAMRGWFALKGYTLYLHSKTNPWEPNMVYEACAYTYPAAPCTAEPRYPYAYIGSTGEPPDRMYPALASIPNGRAVFAQDKQTRHIAIKLVKGGSEEHKILQIIHDDKRLLEKENFCGVIPVLDMLEFDGHWFAVMPRWGTYQQIPWFKTIQEIMDFTHCLLKGLVFLHGHRIFHRDIRNANTLVNHVTNRDIALAMLNTLRLDLRSRGDTLYVLFDFNLSIKLSSEKCLPAEFSMYGVLDKPLDTTRGQIDFDPFAYDVACLGIYLCHSFQQCTRFIPLLAPFLDGMVTYDIKSRFTAEEALRFFEDMRTQMDEKYLNHAVPPATHDNWKHYNRWAGTSPAFFEKWGKYRATHPFRITTWLCNRTWGWTIVTIVRRILRLLYIY